MWEAVRLKGVIEDFPIDEKTFLTKNLLENVSLHFLTLLIIPLPHLSCSPSEQSISQRGVRASKTDIIRLSEEFDFTLCLSDSRN